MAARYQRAGVKTIKTTRPMMLFMLVLTAFIAGAVAERTVHFLQDVIALKPVVEDSLKVFFRERVIFKLTVAADYLKWTGVIVISVLNSVLSDLIRQI